VYKKIKMEITITTCPKCKKPVVMYNEQLTAVCGNCGENVTVPDYKIIKNETHDSKNEKSVDVPD
jgi:ribosomal protein S27AE